MNINTSIIPVTNATFSATAANDHFPLRQLNPDIFEIILSYLDYSSLCNLSLASKEYKERVFHYYKSTNRHSLDEFINKFLQPLIIQNPNNAWTAPDKYFSNLKKTSDTSLRQTNLAKCLVTIYKWNQKLLKKIESGELTESPEMRDAVNAISPRSSNLYVQKTKKYCELTLRFDAIKFDWAVLMAERQTFERINHVFGETVYQLISLSKEYLEIDFYDKSHACFLKAKDFLNYINECNLEAPDEPPEVRVLKRDKLGSLIYHHKDAADAISNLLFGIPDLKNARPFDNQERFFVMIIRGMAHWHIQKNGSSTNYKKLMEYLTFQGFKKPLTIEICLTEFYYQSQFNNFFKFDNIQTDARFKMLYKNIPPIVDSSALRLSIYAGFLEYTHSLSQKDPNNIFYSQLITSCPDTFFNINNDIILGFKEDTENYEAEYSLFSEQIQSLFLEKISFLDSKSYKTIKSVLELPPKQSFLLLKEIITGDLAVNTMCTKHTASIYLKTHQLKLIFESENLSSNQKDELAIHLLDKYIEFVKHFTQNNNLQTGKPLLEHLSKDFALFLLLNIKDENLLSENTKKTLKFAISIDSKISENSPHLLTNSAEHFINILQKLNRNDLIIHIRGFIETGAIFSARELAQISLNNSNKREDPIVPRLKPSIRSPETMDMSTFRSINPTLVREIPATAQDTSNLSGILNQYPRSDKDHLIAQDFFSSLKRKPASEDSHLEPETKKQKTSEIHD